MVRQTRTLRFFSLFRFLSEFIMSSEYVKDVYGGFSQSGRLAELLRKGVAQASTSQCKYKTVGRVLKCPESQCPDCNPAKTKECLTVSKLSQTDCNSDNEFVTPVPKSSYKFTSKSKRTRLSLKRSAKAGRITSNSKIKILDVVTFKDNEMIREQIKSQSTCADNNNFSGVQNLTLSSVQNVDENFDSFSGIKNLHLSAVQRADKNWLGNFQISLINSHKSCSASKPCTIVRESQHVSDPLSHPFTQISNFIGGQKSAVGTSESLKTEEQEKKRCANSLETKAEGDKKKTSTENRGGGAPLRYSREYHIQEIYKLKSAKEEVWKLVEQLQDRISSIDSEITYHQEVIFRDEF